MQQNAAVAEATQLFDRQSKEGEETKIRRFGRCGCVPTLRPLRDLMDGIHINHHSNLPDLFVVVLTSKRRLTKNL